VSTGTVAPFETLVVSCTGAAVVGVADAEGEAEAEGEEASTGGLLVRLVGAVVAQPARIRAEPAPA